MGKSSKVLNRKQVYAYINQYKAGDINARNIIIEHNVGLAHTIIKQYFSSAPYEETELITVGLLQLMEKLDKFDISRGTPFSSWAAVVIRHAIGKYLLASNKYRLDSLDAIIDVELSRDAETQPFDINEILINEMNYYNSKSQEYDEEGEYRKELDYSVVNDYGIMLKDTLCDDDFDFTQKIANAQILEHFYEFFCTLSEREKNIIALYFGLFGNQPHTCSELATLLHISKSRVSSIINEILDSFRDEIQCAKPTNFSLHKARKSN